MSPRLPLLLLLALLALPAPAQDAELELKVKAAFLFNFAKFVDWPQEKFAGPAAAIELCVLEPDAFGEVLEETVRGKQIGARPLQVRRTTPERDLTGCHLLFAGDQDPMRLAGLFGQVSGTGVMTVHESPQAVPGGVARLFLDQRRMRFEINTTAAEREHLQISSKLLSVAEVVKR